MKGFTEEELMIAKSVDLCEVARTLGYTVKRVGNCHTIKEMDSIRIYHRKTWFRWSKQYDKGENGGTQIDFLRVFAGLSVKDAVSWLLDFTGYKKNDNIDNKVHNKEKLQHLSIEKEDEKKPFVLPSRADGFSYVWSYLTEQRKIDKNIVTYFLEQGLIYEDRQYHNIVFKGVDKNGVTRFASRRGVFDDAGKPFKCDVAGSDKRYGFNHATGSEVLIVFEGAIDLLSYIDLYSDIESNKIALGMLADQPIMTFLNEHPNIIKIKVCLDNDEPGRIAAEKIINKYRKLGYEVENFPPPKEFKDYNEYLRHEKVRKKQGVEKYR